MMKESIAVAITAGMLNNPMKGCHDQNKYLVANHSYRGDTTMFEKANCAQIKVKSRFLSSKYRNIKIAAIIKVRLRILCGI